MLTYDYMIKTKGNIKGCWIVALVGDLTRPKLPIIAHRRKYLEAEFLFKITTWSSNANRFFSKTGIRDKLIPLQHLKCI